MSERNANDVSAELELLGVEELPAELEEAWVDALCGAEVSPELALWLESHPGAAAELRSLGEVAAMIGEDVESQRPGVHFFDALADDVMAGLDRSEAPVRVVELEGGLVESPEASAVSSGSWLSRLRALLVDRPTVGYGVGMAVALVGIVLWTMSGSGDRPVPGGEADAGVRIVEADVDTADASASPERSFAAGLSASERAELEAMAREIEIDFDDDSDDDGEDDDADAFDDWGAGVVGLTSGDEDLDAFEEELRRSL